MYYSKKLVLSFFLFLFSYAINAQLFLQLEKYNSTKTIKFFPGDQLEFKLKDFPKTWRKKVIVDIKPKENIIVFEDNFYNLDAFYAIRIDKPWAKGLGIKLMQFSAAWYLYGGIATLVDSDYNMSKSEIVIGGVIAAIGYFIKSIFQRKKFKLNKRKRLRIMDLRFKLGANQ